MTSPTSDRRQGLVGNTPFKAPVDCATTGNITLAGEQIIDGVQTNGSRVLVWRQTDQTQNGIYLTGTAAWTRSADADGNYDLTTGTLVSIIGGSSLGGNFFQVSTPKPFTIGTSVLNWVKALFSSSALLSYLLSAAGAVARSVQDVLTDTVSSKSFGATGDYNINTKTGTLETAAIQAFWNYCAASGRRGRQVGVSLVDPNGLVPPVSGQLNIIGAGAKLTFDSGYALKTGAVGQRFLTGAGQDLSLAFVNFENLVFEGPGIGSGVDCFYGDFYQGGAQGCIFRNWRTAGTHFGSLNTFRHNRFLSCVNGLLVTNWPAGTTQASASTTTFLSERNNFNGCTGRGLAFDTSTTGGGNIVSSASILDTFEGGCGTSLYVNKSFDLLILRPHCENSVTNSFVFIDSSPNLIPGYFGGGDAAKVSYTWPGAAANGAGYNQLDLSGLLTRGLYLQTKNGVAQMTANDAGGVDLAGAGLVTAWTPTVGASSGTTTGNAYSLQEGYALKFGKYVFASFRIVMTAKDAGMGGVILINGLPFAADAGKSNAYGNALRYSNVTLNGGAFTELLCDVSGVSGMPIKVGSGLAPTNLAPADIVATTTLSGSMVYLGA